ncbi:zf-HC2 domain-containing protein [Streptomyces gulbargensis]|uniref:Zf-HC2 domain-containing protein n=1 Tax=Streptomyces gulbargensis TaxID=364901 RepID=A0ABP7N933_9ACTN
MSGTRPSSPTPAEHHLGDRLAALVDGELGHDARERVLAHLATCARCKAEADAQRTLKSVFASTAPPAPSEGFLARLQGLPGGPTGGPGAPGGPGEPVAPRGPLEELLGSGGVKSDGFATAAVVTPGPGTGRGFRIHEVDRGAAPSGRGRRFAFAAASAVSFAAIALGGTLPLESSVNAGARGQGTGSAITPLRASASATGPGASTVRGARSGERSTGAQSLAGEAAPFAARPLTLPRGPLAPGNVPPVAVHSAPSPLVAVRFQNQAAHPLFALSPFIRPTGPVPHLALGPVPSPAPGPSTLPLGSPR